MSWIRCTDISKSYPEGQTRHTVLEKLSLELEKGTFAALVGRSGSGKSTLLNLLAGLDVPETGQIVVADTEISALSEDHRARFRRRQVGFVFQFFNLMPTLTARENILLSLELKGLPPDDARVAELLTALGLGHRADSFPDQLSGGEQQRIAVARALVHSPALVVADEPTGNLDDQTGQTVLSLLKDLSRECGTTLVIATHSQEIAASADRVLRLEAGRLTA